MASSEYSRRSARGARKSMILQAWHQFAARYNEVMFFRRERPKTSTVQERVQALAGKGFSLTEGPGGLRQVTRANCAADLSVSNDTLAVEDRAGILIGGEIGFLIDGGFQKFFRTKS